MRFAEVALVCGLASPAWAETFPGPKPPVFERLEGIVRTIEDNRPGHPRSLQARGIPERTFEVSEAEINESLVHLAATDRKRRLHSASVQLKEGRVFEVDVIASIGDKTLGKMDGEAEGLFGRGLRRLLKAENRIQAEGFFTSAKGKGFFQVRWAKLNGFVLPDSWVHKIVELVGRHQKPPVDFNRLFDLPNGIDKVEVLPDSVRLRLKAI